MSLFMPYVFVVHSRLVLTRLPLAKAFLRAILTVNTYPLDWHNLREYVDVSLDIALVRAPLHRHELLPSPPPFYHPPSSPAVSQAAAASRRFGPGVTREGVILFCRRIGPSPSA